MCRFRFWDQTLSPPSEISRTAVDQLALPYCWAPIDYTTHLSSTVLLTPTMLSLVFINTFSKWASGDLEWNMLNVFCMTCYSGFLIAYIDAMVGPVTRSTRLFPWFWILGSTSMLMPPLLHKDEWKDDQKIVGGNLISNMPLSLSLLDI
jgi:hypothetical protein